MKGLPEEAVFAAARAVFEHCLINSCNRENKARHWLSDASEYREIARVALSAALPLMEEEPSPRAAPS